MNSSPIVLVTGASGGIGTATTRLLLREGYHVIAHYAENLSAVTALAEYAAAQGRKCWPVRADLANAADIEQVISEIDTLLGDSQGSELVGIVNNAAALLGPSLEQASVEKFDHYMALNTRAPFFLTQQLSLRMESGGSIVNVSSAGVHFSNPGDIVYAISKAAVEAFTRHAAEVLASKNIRINAVIPGFTDNGHPAFSEPEIREYMGSFSVLGDVASPRRRRRSCCLPAFKPFSTDHRHNARHERRQRPGGTSCGYIRLLAILH
ncbi:SDR family NAD(P)-dependent oxidoreductase [Brevibacterium luteolum]|uniref:SDR family oxidoreductase n=1 Tax=Brevibacterium luteolum TaxID=199591 RepID=A0A849B565_9MICO|nr:SDR family oxidoreductase [Brevibacterium luteolum]MBM7529402.1 3-oxoacyl-[acyl-carrier protein] reductase [Brevibacterium luteolum]NNG80326.1 SDR family oxidoreductase [Brevibacterium luteolum]